MGKRGRKNAQGMSLEELSEFLEPDIKETEALLKEWKASQRK